MNNREVNCGRCHAVVRHGRARGLVVAFCHCLPREARQALMKALGDLQMEVERAN